jgi:hypothetical protein
MAFENQMTAALLTPVTCASGVGLHGPWIRDA